MNKLPFQFSLSSLFWLMTCAAAVAAWIDLHWVTAAVAACLDPPWLISFTFVGGLLWAIQAAEAAGTAIMKSVHQLDHESVRWTDPRVD